MTRAELVAFQGQIEERLAELLSLARTRTGNGDDTTPPAQRSAAPAAAQASGRESAGNGGSREDPNDRHNADGGVGCGGGSVQGGRSGGRDRRGGGWEEKGVETPERSDDDGGGSSGSDGTLPGWGGGGEAEMSTGERRARRGAIVYHPDGFDDPNLPAAHDIIHAYDIPAAVRRRDGIPVPFEPADTRFLSRFKDGSAEFHEAAFAYQVAAWTQELSNAALALYYERDSFSAAGLADRLAGAAVASPQLFHLATAQYDYLEYKQRDPVGAALYRATEAVPRNTLRGPKGRRWLATVASDEVKINIKTAAEERANKHRRGKAKAERKAAAGAAAAGRMPSRVHFGSAERSLSSRPCGRCCALKRAASRGGGTCDWVIRR